MAVAHADDKEFVIVPQLCFMTKQQKGQPLNLVCYNVLAELLAKSDQYPYADPRVLDWDYRGPRIVTEVIQSDADIICFQEFCDKEFFTEKLA